MNDPTSRHTDRTPRPAVVIVVDDPTQLPSLEVVAASPPPSAGAPFIERRKRATDRRRGTRPDADAAVSAGPRPPQALRGPPAIDARHPCTDREREIVELLRRGSTNKQIAQQLGIAEETVKKHLQHIYDKFGVRRRALVMLGHVGARTYMDRNPAFP
jgi:DNA-binding NarL/FixJ family response regulator